VPRRHKKPPQDLLNTLARANRLLGRLGGEPFCTVAEAEELSDYRVRELVAMTEEHVAALQRATRGYLG
jgi:hypothetical protein